MSVSIHPADRPSWDFNLANDNFEELMQLVGVSRDEYYTEWGLTGELSVERLRALRPTVSDALALVRAMPGLDDGTPTREIPNPGRCRVFIGGHSPGWYEHRLRQLLNCIDDCISRKVTLIYG